MPEPSSGLGLTCPPAATQQAFSPHSKLSQQLPTLIFHSHYCHPQLWPVEHRCLNFDPCLHGSRWLFGLSRGGAEAVTAVEELGRQSGELVEATIIRRAARKLLRAAAAAPHVSSIYDIVIPASVAIEQTYKISLRYCRYAPGTGNLLRNYIIMFSTPCKNTFYSFTSLLIEISHFV